MTELAEPYWKEQQNIIEKRVEKEGLNFFLQWKEIQHNMFHELHSEKFHALRNSKYWHQWESALKEDDFGNPRRYSLYPESSGNLLHHAHSLWQFAEFLTNFDAKKIESIFEFGGGYGSFCRLMRKLGMDGTYILYDLPLFLKIQDSYLKGIGLPSFRNSFYSNLNEHTCVDMFVSMWAISESPIELRNKIFAHVSANKYLIIYQKQFEGVENSRYFNNFITTKPDFIWITYEVPLLPNNFYLFGVKK